MVQCTECDKWRIVFAKKKLTRRQKVQLTDLLEDLDFTCGFQFGKNYVVDFSLTFLSALDGENFVV